VKNPNPDPALHQQIPVWNAENWFYEDIEIGHHIRSIRRTISEGELCCIANIFRRSCVVRRPPREQDLNRLLTEMTVGDLTVGCECGASDGTSGLAGNPAVGACFDRLVDAGGNAVFEETVEMVSLLPVMWSRADDDQARQRLEAAHAKMDAYSKSVRQHSIAPGNFAGGLSTIEEKSMGAL
jgi:hypothetical protein